MFFRDNQTVTHRVFSNNHYKCTVCAEYIYTILFIECNIITVSQFSLTTESNSEFSFQSSQVILNDMGQSLHFRVPAFAPGNGSVSTKEAPQSQLQLEFGLPLSKVSVHVVAIGKFGQEWCLPLHAVK